MSSNFCFINLKRGPIALMLALMLALSMPPALAQVWHAELPHAKSVGQGEMRWFGLRIYGATLWSERIPFDARAPFALELTYHRHISREQFVQTSIDEIKRLTGQRFSAGKLQLWETLMSRAFHDVDDGDQFIGVFIPQHGCRFYDNSKLLADINDPEFAEAFFSIWLDERSKDSSLRQHLLGLTQ